MWVELSELIESVDILEYISQYTEFTEKNGEYWALSPFKDEKTPSFSVRKETNSFYDFSSGIGGNVLTFIRYYDKCGYFSDNEGHIFAKITNDSKSQKIVHVEAGNGFMQAIFIPYGITYSDDATGVRNGGMGSTDGKA